MRFQRSGNGFGRPVLCVVVAGELGGGDDDVEQEFDEVCQCLHAQKRICLSRNAVGNRS